MKLFTLSFAAMLFGAVSFAQIPITTNNVCDPSLPPGGPACSITATGPLAPQPQLVPCTPTTNTLLNTNWAFTTSAPGPVAFRAANPTAIPPVTQIDQVDGRFQIGTFSITQGGRGLTVNGTLSTLDTFSGPNNLPPPLNGNRVSGTSLQRLAPFSGSIDGLCIAGTNILAAGTIQIADGLGGSLLTWSYPITATIQLDRRVTYAVTSVTTMNFTRYGALDPPSTTNGYGYDNAYITSGTANQLVGQLPCPVGNENSVLDTGSPFGFGVGTSAANALTTGTQLVFKPGFGPQGIVTGNLSGNDNNGRTNGSPTVSPNPGNINAQPQPTETGNYDVYRGCSGFHMNFPLIRNGLIIGSNFEGVFADGTFSRLFILGLNQSADANVVVGPITLFRLTAAPVLAPFPAVPTGR